ncbi:hypothetical protein [uncultured Algoriphagus sp.]|nr:hypothetical protein [uncultured Algoriphagus sp.]
MHIEGCPEESGKMCDDPTTGRNSSQPYGTGEVLTANRQIKN